jgi:hypothetical protein
MMFLKLLATHEQGVASFFTSKNNRDRSRTFVHVEQQSIFAK